MVMKKFNTEYFLYKLNIFITTKKINKLQTPLRVQKGDKIKATFWRCVTRRRVWYEWIVEVGEHTTPLHNPNGRSSEMLL